MIETLRTLDLGFMRLEYTLNPVSFAWWEWACMIGISAALAFVPFYLAIREEP